MAGGPPLWPEACWRGWPRNTKERWVRGKRSGRRCPNWPGRPGGAVSFSRRPAHRPGSRRQRMQGNLALTRGLVVAERVTLELAPLIGYDDARRVVEEASRRAAVAFVRSLWRGKRCPWNRPQPAGFTPATARRRLRPGRLAGFVRGVRRPRARFVPQGLRRMADRVAHGGGRLRR